MRRMIALTFCLSMLALASHLTAQEKLPKAGPEHEVLKEGEGTWDATVKSKDGESKGVLMCKGDLNGLWYLEHFSAKLGDIGFEGRGATSYDAAKKKYVNVWIDSMSTSPMVTEGTYDKATKTLTMKGDMPMPDGKSMKVTLTTVTKDADTRSFTIRSAGPDGKDFEMLNITYKRRAK
jgi:hypothetical protein